MEIPIVGSTYEMDAKSFGVEVCRNFYPIVAEVQNTKTVSALRSTPGLRLFASVGGGAIREGYTSRRTNRAFVVSGAEFYEVFADGTSALLGTLNTFVGQVSIAENTIQIFIADGRDGYVFDLGTGVFEQVTDEDFQGAGVVTYQDGYFIVNRPDTNEFYVSAINNGLEWDALDFTTVQSSPDNVVSLISDKSNVWAFCQESTEVFINTGNVDFPFERRPGAIIPTGCAAPHTPQILDNTVVWLGVDNQGRGVVWRAVGFDAARVSTQAIERRIDEAEDFTESFAWVYHEQGHVFYCLQIQGLDTTLVLDMATGLWHERSFRNAELNRNEQHRGSSHFFFAQKNLIGDRENGNIYDMDLDYFDDAGDEIIRERITPHLQDLKRLVNHSTLELDLEVGVGKLNAPEPQIGLSYSDDGGRTWSRELFVSVGAEGEFDKRVRWHRLGASRNRVYRIRMSDPVFWQINGAYLNAA